MVFQMSKVGCLLFLIGSLNVSFIYQKPSMLRKLVLAVFKVCVMYVLCLGILVTPNFAQKM